MTREETNKKLSDNGMYITVEPCYATMEKPFRWKVMKIQGYWGGSASYYAPVAFGDSSTREIAREDAEKYTLENLISNDKSD
ncbi:MAG: hypothetical protein J6W60_08885 [Treponema sp.]|nr:hypothetical protein [Muribaculaceae bacterium]MBP5752955.1 hypothetical protein [Treponema sp.]